ncbi:MAG: potassium-transporting ATPase subunit B, partial [Burkholderiales bacterium]
MRTATLSTLSGPILRRAVRDSFVKLDPRVQWKNPVMFVVLVGSALVTLLWISGTGAESRTFVFAVALWLWFTLLFANFAESMAEG